MKSLLRDYFLAVGSYIALIVIGLVATLTVSSAVGYLPYSDRPGPGWVGPSFSLEQLGYYVSWGALLLIPTAIFGTAAFGYHRLLKFLDTPSLLIRVVGGLTGGVISLVLASGVGWYISMAAFPVWIAGALGGVWGVVLLPRHLGPAGRMRPPWAKWAAISVVLLGGPSVLYLTFFAPRYGQNVQLTVLRVIESTEPLARENWESNLEPREAALLDSLFPNSHLERGFTGFSSTGAGDRKARMLIVVTGPLRTDALLRVPKGVSVAYIQQGDRWDMFPPDAPTLRERIRLAAGAKPNEVSFAWSGGDTSTFTWARD